MQFPYNKNLNALCSVTIEISGKPFHLYHRNVFVTTNFDKVNSMFFRELYCFLSHVHSSNYLPIFFDIDSF